MSDKELFERDMWNLRQMAEHVKGHLIRGYALSNDETIELLTIARWLEDYAHSNLVHRPAITEETKANKGELAA